MPPFFGKPLLLAPIWMYPLFDESLFPAMIELFKIKIPLIS